MPRQPPPRSPRSRPQGAAVEYGLERDRGMVTAFVVIFATALVFVSALVVDGGRMLAEHRKVDNLADSAARAGAQAIDEDAVRQGETVNVLDEAVAVDLACGFIADARAGNGCGGGTTVAVDGGEVTVTVEGRIDLLLFAGADRRVRGAGTACVAVGIGTETDC